MHGGSIVSVLRRGTSPPSPGTSTLSTVMLYPLSTRAQHLEQIGGRSVSRLERNWQYAEQFPNETESQIRARRLSLELGIEPVSRAVAAQLSVLTVATAAENICEIGTGVGVSGLALMRHAPHATLTSIDAEPEHLRQAKSIFAEAGIPASRLRLIEGDARRVLTRLNHGSYDFVIIDAAPEHLLEFVEHALLICRTGGTIVIPGVFVRGRVTDPAARDQSAAVARDLLGMVSDSPAIAAALSSVGDGLLILTKLEEQLDG